MRGIVGALLASVLAGLALAGQANAAVKWAPLDKNGPAFGVDREKLRNSLSCGPGVRDARRTPVLLAPATGVDSEANFSWNYARLLNQRGIPWCASDQFRIRRYNQTDIQVRGQYLAFAIRKMHRMAGRKISILGHSQGGMAMRWPLRFWPNTRRMVDDVIGMAGTNRGTASARFSCGDGACTPAQWQQWDISNFMKALNSRSETFRGISYTEIFTERDLVVTPPRRASSVGGPGRITNVAVQQICPGSTADHLSIGTADPVAAALALDALGRPGPADPGAISPSVCARPYHAGINPRTFISDLTRAASVLARSQGIPTHGKEPRLACYVFANKKACRKARAAGM
jgi:triacylglycerol esterase/lipase EstA (alpha/beta hydrolase family)